MLCIRSNLLEYLAGRSANRQMHIRDMIARTPANGDALHEKEGLVLVAGPITSLWVIRRICLRSIKVQV